MSRLTFFTLVFSCFLSTLATADNGIHVDITHIKLNTKLTVIKESVPGMSTIRDIETQGKYAIALNNDPLYVSLPQLSAAIYDGKRWNVIHWPTIYPKSPERSTAYHAIVDMTITKSGISIWLRGIDTNGKTTIYHFNGKSWKQLQIPRKLTEFFNNRYYALFESGDNIYFLAYREQDEYFTVYHVVYNMRKNRWSEIATFPRTFITGKAYLGANRGKNNVLVEYGRFDEKAFEIHPEGEGRIDADNTYHELSFPGNDKAHARFLMSSTNHTIIHANNHYFVSDDDKFESWKTIQGYNPLSMTPADMTSLSGNTFCSYSNDYSLNRAELYCSDLSNPQPQWSDAIDIPIDIHQFWTFAYTSAHGVWFGNRGNCPLEYDGTVTEACAQSMRHLLYYDMNSGAKEEIPLDFNNPNLFTINPITFDDHQVVISTCPQYNEYDLNPAPCNYLYYNRELPANGWRQVTLPLSYTHVQTSWKLDSELQMQQVWIFPIYWEKPIKQHHKLARKNSLLRNKTMLFGIPASMKSLKRGK